MRATVLTFWLISLAAITSAHANDHDDLSLREFDDIILDAREVLSDLGLHSRALHSARRLDELEARMAILEDQLELEARRGGGASGGGHGAAAAAAASKNKPMRNKPKAKKAKKVKVPKLVCPHCHSEFKDANEYATHVKHCK